MKNDSNDRDAVCRLCDDSNMATDKGAASVLKALQGMVNSPAKPASQSKTLPGNDGPNGPVSYTGAD